MHRAVARLTSVQAVQVRQVLKPLTAKGSQQAYRTLDSFIKCSGKKVNATTKNKICERTAALVAAAHLPYRFVENNELDKFA